jgi:cellulose synthase/poly-beta-1,6-N-acetylglucosamine synthase-like glycosyltransferase
VVAHNEAPRIKTRIDNLLALDYPRDRLEIVIASDGSTDGTPECAYAYTSQGVTVIPFEKRRGKPAVLNEVVPRARGEIVVFADVRQRFSVSALRGLTKVFADPAVGGVSGELLLSPNAGGEEASGIGEGVGFYWRYEKFIRRNESRVDSTVGATGAIYAIRKGLFEPIPDDTLLDDVLIPMRIVRRGYRVLFAPEVWAYDRMTVTTREEVTRKVRTIAGNFQLLTRERWLLTPFRNRLWLQTLSHKALRLLSPVLLLLVFGVNLLLLDRTLFRWTLAAQVLFYGIALGGFMVRNRRAKVRLLTVPYVFCLLNWVTVVAFLRFLRSRQQVTWEKASA